MTPAATRAIAGDLCGGPYALKTIPLREQRLSHVEDAHVEPLHTLVGQIRAETSKHENVPTFDPCEGGINAPILLLLEAPGPKAVETGLVSINNPDDTAANLYNLLEEARIDRHHIIMWNIVPWYLGRTDRSRIRPATCKCQRRFGRGRFRRFRALRFRRRLGHGVLLLGGGESGLLAVA